MDAFSGVYLNGFIKEATFTERLRVMILIPFTSSFMACIGFLLGGVITSLLSEFSITLTVGLIFIIGFKFIIKSFKPKFQEMTYELTQLKTLIGFSFALGINAFLLGLALPLFEIGIINILIVFAIVFIIVTSLAMFFGKRSNRFIVASRLILIGGFFISGSAVYYIIEYFNFI